jgi:RNA polymerase sigma-70 factor (ECF subfamily)
MQQVLTQSQWAEIIDTYYADIFRFCCHFLGDGTQAQDATQDVFLKLYLALNAGSNLPEMRAWLYRVARNACIDRKRWWKRYFQVFSGKELPERAAATRADQSLLTRSLRALIDSLPRRQKEVFILRHWHECSTEETAQILGIDAGSVKSHLNRAIASLRERLRDLEPGLIEPTEETRQPKQSEPRSL